MLRLAPLRHAKSRLNLFPDGPGSARQEQCYAFVDGANTHRATHQEDTAQIDSHDAVEVERVDLVRGDIGLARDA